MTCLYGRCASHSVMGSVLEVSGGPSLRPGVPTGLMSARSREPSKSTMYCRCERVISLFSLSLLKTMGGRRRVDRDLVREIALTVPS
jgi:hypothetical protein